MRIAPQRRTASIVRTPAEEGTQADQTLRECTWSFTEQDRCQGIDSTLHIAETDIAPKSSCRTHDLQHLVPTMNSAHMVILFTIRLCDELVIPLGQLTNFLLGCILSGCEQEGFVIRILF